MILRTLFIIAGFAGIIAIFYVSWFWRALIAPMIIILFWDTIASFLRKKND